MGEGGVGGHHLSAADNDAALDFLINRDEYVLDLIHRLVAVNGRIDDGVVEVEAGFLDALVPGTGVLLEATVELGVGAQGAAEGGLVVRGATHPAVGQPRPFGNGIALLAQVTGGTSEAEELVGVTAVAGIGLPAQLVLGGRVVQGVVEFGHGRRGVTKGGVCGHVLDAIAVDVDLAVVPEAGEVLGTCQGAIGFGAIVFGFHGGQDSVSLLLWVRSRRLTPASPAACRD